MISALREQQTELCTAVFYEHHHCQGWFVVFCCFSCQIKLLFFTALWVLSLQTFFTRGSTLFHLAHHDLAEWNMTVVVLPLALCFLEYE
jgi:hypothetical protein